MGEDSERMGEDLEDEETGLGGGRNGTLNRMKQGLREARNKGFEKDGNGTLRREKKGIGNHVIL